MECNILREIKFKEVTFRIEGNPCWKVIGNRIHGISRGCFSVYKNDILQYVLKQTNVWKQIIGILPIINLFYKNPFTFQRNGEMCGYSKRRTKMFGQGLYEVHFGTDVFLVSIHSKGVHSLLKNGSQVAVYKRLATGNYKVKCDIKGEEMLGVLVLFAAFVELMFTLDTIAGRDPETFIIPCDKYIDRAQWQPNDKTSG